MSSAPDLAWRRLTGFARLMAVGWVVALLYHYVMGGVLHLPYPFNTFLFDPAGRLADFTNTWTEARAPQPYATSGPAIATYFPVVYAGLKVLHRASRPWASAVYLLATLGAMAGLAAVWVRRERPRWAGDERWRVVPPLVLFVVLGNYPFLFALDRGSIDPIITALSAAAVLWLMAGRRLAAGALLGVAAAAKGYPLAVGALWLRRRGLLGVVAAGAVLAALVVLPGLLFAGGIPATLRGLAAGLGRYRELYVFGDWSAHYSADGLNGLRVALSALRRPPDMAVLVPLWEKLALVWAAALAVDGILFAGPLWRQALAVVLVMLVFPNVTNDYKLVLLVPVVLAWISSAEDSGWRDRVFAGCAVLLFVPKHYGPPLAGPDGTVSCVVSPFLLAGLSAALWPTAVELAEARQRIARLRAVVGARPGPSGGAALGERR